MRPQSIEQATYEYLLNAAPRLHCDSPLWMGYCPVAMVFTRKEPVFCPLAGKLADALDVPDSQLPGEIFKRSPSIRTQSPKTPRFRGSSWRENRHLGGHELL